jgi:hypothetical protein
MRSNPKGRGPAVRVALVRNWLLGVPDWVDIAGNLDVNIQTRGNHSAERAPIIGERVAFRAIDCRTGSDFRM